MELDESDSARPHKRSRLNTDSAAPRTRAATACERCRSRKTRCDNGRPICGYCSKHNVDCVYSDDAVSSNLLEAGDRILAAIGDLKFSFEAHQRYCSSLQHRFNDGNFHTDSRPARETTPYRDVEHERYTEPQHSVSINTHRSRSRPEGMETILQWSILVPFSTTASLVGGQNDIRTSANGIPNLSYRELSRLATKYIDGVHIKNPILDLAILQADIFHVAENGLDWSTRTCLVSLISAIGAVSQQHSDHRLYLNGQTPLSQVMSPVSRAEVEVNLSFQYWDIAVKRIGLAIAEDTVQAVQCLCLAAIWQMHHVRPVQAWKYFNLAGAAWHTLNSNNPIDVTASSEAALRLQSFTVMQSLFFTIWKSEGELKMELDLPESILDNVKFPYSFPQPPVLDTSNSPEDEVAEDERSWLYYLADIAIRHLLNRLSTTNLELSLDNNRPLTRRDLHQMISEADMLETQLFEWHRSLPHIFRFRIPDHDQLSCDPDYDDRVKVLYHRLLSYRSLVNRPFVRLLVDRNSSTSLVQELFRDDVALEDEVVRRASLCLHYCMMKINPISNHRHQGTWTALRNLGTTAMIFSAVHLSIKQDAMPSLRHAFQLPVGWYQQVLQSIHDMQPYWEEGSGGSAEIRRTIEEVLDAVASV